MQLGSDQIWSISTHAHPLLYQTIATDGGIVCYHLGRPPSTPPRPDAGTHNNDLRVEVVVWREDFGHTTVGHIYLDAPRGNVLRSQNKHTVVSYQNTKSFEKYTYYTDIVICKENYFCFLFFKFTNMN